MTLPVLTRTGSTKKKIGRKTETESRNREGSKDGYGEQDSYEDSDVQDIDEQDADHAMDDEAHYKNDKMTMSDGDTESLNNLFYEDGSDDGKKLGDKAIGGQREEGGIETSND
jgi:hypothetical protein